MPGNPNIVLVMTDQQRADFSRSEGFPLDPMPFIDSLGAQGTRFRHATRFVRWREDRDARSCRYDQLEQVPPAELAQLLGG